MNNIVTLTNVKKRYRHFSLNGISFELPEGAIMGIIGPNGAGKTTTMKILMNLIKADTGAVRILDCDHRKHSRYLKNKIGYVGETPYFYGNKTVAWTGRYNSGFYRIWDENRFQGYLTHFSLSRTKRTRELSKGMKIKLSLALALAHRPRLIILDEPTAGLDPIIRREILMLLKTLCLEEGTSILISSHITDDIARIADFVTFIVDGNQVLFTEMSDLHSQWKRLYFKPGTVDETLFSGLLDRTDHAFGSSGITGSYPKLEKKIAAELTRGDIKVVNASLDDILVAFVKGE